ncbi:protein rep [Pseudomonas putida]|uniref:protein rep n=1 Tax=Pseudomonas putida TaxID=303 RepID=UPI00064C785D|nr:protein rep [Pseudomonas putida]
MHHSSDVEGALDPSYRQPVAGADEAAKAALGINAKSSTTCEDAKNTAKSRAVRAERFFALAKSREIFARESASIGIKHYDKFHRTFACHHNRIGTFVEVHRSAEHQKAFYGGLATCGSVWACPVCAAKIQERRREEIAQAIHHAYGEGKYAPAMVTFTFPHMHADVLRSLILKQREAFKYLREGNSFRLFCKRFGYKGLIRSLEVTHGQNGWHPHTHELWFIRPLKKAEREAFLDFVKSRWEKACIKAGLIDPTDLVKMRSFRMYSCDVRFNVTTGDYLAKQDGSRHWGADREMANSKAKTKNKFKGCHPHDFLVRDDDSGRRHYLEYALTMRDLRCRQLYWSPGLKDWAGIDEKDDEDIAQEQTESADILGFLTADEWRLVYKAKAEAELLDIADTGDWERVQLLLKSLAPAVEIEAETAAAIEAVQEEKPAVRDVPAHLTRNALTTRRKGAVMVPCNYTQAPFWLELAQWKLVDELGAYEALVAVYETALRTSGLHVDSDEYSALAASVLDDALACLSACHQ